MRKITGLLFALFATGVLLAQAPNGFKYQAVLRNTDGTIKANESVSLEIDILKSSATGSSVYSESHNVTTNTYGLVNLVVGDGTSSDDLASIEWGNDEYFIKISVDGAEFGTSQLLSVPYALHAKTAETVTGAITETDPVYSSSVASSISVADTLNWNNKQDEVIAGDGIRVSGDTISVLENDTNNTDELQNLAIDGNVLSITNGNSVELTSGSNVNDTLLIKSESGAVWSIKVGNTGGLETEQIAHNGFFTYEVTLGAWFSSVAGQYASSNGQSYTSGVADEYSDIIDILYVYDSISLISPDVSTFTWTTLNETKFKKTTMSSADFDNFQSAQDISANAVNASFSAVANLELGDVVAFFSPVKNKYGLIKIVNVNSGDRGDITIQLKVEE